MGPHFLIVGAMKAGTTTLYRDLSKHPEVFLPGLKEPNILIDYSDHQAISDEYSSLFRSALPGQFCGDASTSYTKLPDYKGVAKNAFAYCGRNLKIIYMRREPISRIVSQYKHELQHGTINDSFDKAIKKVPRLINYSRYDYQIAPWLECFGPENVLQINLHEYSQLRAEKLDEVYKFLGVSPKTVDELKIDIDKVSNRANEAKTIDNPVLRNIIYSAFYQKGVKRFFSDQFREKIRNIILGRPQSNDVEPSEDACEYILAELKKTLL